MFEELHRNFNTSKISAPPRALRREDAASYISISPSKFDQLVEDGRMPKSIRIDGCVLWDIKDIDSAFEDLKSGHLSSSWTKRAA